MQAAHLSPMADAEVTTAARMAARSRRAPDLWIAALGSISGDLAQSLPPDFQSPLRRGRGCLFYTCDLEILHMFKYVRTLSVAIEVSGIGAILSLPLPLHSFFPIFQASGMRQRNISYPERTYQAGQNWNIYKLKFWVICILHLNLQAVEPKATKRTNVQSPLEEKKNILSAHKLVLCTHIIIMLRYQHRQCYYAVHGLLSP